MRPTAGLRHGRDWTELASDEAVVDWNVQPDQGLIQGPLDLGFLHGRRVFLTLDPGQVALLIGDGRVQAVYLDGGHMLDIGHGRGQVPSEGSIVFLSVGAGLEVRWTDDDPLPRAGASDLVGCCTLAVAGPGRFYDTFLAGDAAWDEEFILRLVRQATRVAVERHLDAAPPEARDAAARLADLDPAALDEELAPLGLTCRTAQLDEIGSVAPAPGAPATTGQFCVPGHN